MDEAHTFPAFLLLSDRSCLMLGGGSEAATKGAILLRAGARLTVVARELVPELEERAHRGEFTWLRESFRPEHLDGVWLVLSTLPEAENARIYQETERRRILLNVVDQPRYCSFHWPARVERPPVIVAFSTAGSSPALAAYLRRRLEAWLHPDIGALARWLSVWRQRVAPRLSGLSARGRFWRRLLDRGLAERYLAGELTTAESMIREAIGRDADIVD